MQIFITTPSGKQVTLDVEGGDRILVVKQKLSDKEGITPAHQVGRHILVREGRLRLICAYSVQAIKFLSTPHLLHL